MLRTITAILLAGAVGAGIGISHAHAPAQPTDTATSITGTDRSGVTAAAKPKNNPLMRKARKLPVRAETRAGYRRELFPHWTDADNDGCDTRREVILAEAATPATVTGDCWINGGTWYSIYDGVTIDGYPTSFDVDHLIPLAEAWDSGANRWDTPRRQAFANDLDNPASLILVTASSNRSKSDQEPHQWMPPNGQAHCGYLADWVRVKHRWKLSVDRDERRFLLRNLRGCPAGATLVQR